MNSYRSVFLLLHQLLMLLVLLSYANSKCISTRDCELAQRYMKFHSYNSTITLWLRDAVCGFDDSQNPKIQCDALPPFSDCIPMHECPFAKQTLNKRLKLKKSMPKNFISSLCGPKFDFINCIEYSKKILEPKLKKNCGVINKFDLRIANGEPANITDFPWVALFQYMDEKLICAGVLISKRYIVTAAHCIDGYQQNIMTVRLGVYNKTDSNDGVKYAIKKWHIHPQYNKTIVKSDIALVRLGKLLESCTKNFYLIPICFNRNLINELKEHQSLKIAGFGNLQRNVQSEIMRQAVVSLRANSYKLQGSEHIYKYDKIIATSQNDTHNPTDTCTGDSGGPIMMINDTYLLGVTSVGPRICGNGGMYTNIAVYVEWLLDTMIADEFNLVNNKIINKKFKKIKKNKIT